MKYDIYYSTTRKNKKYLVYGKGCLVDFVKDAKRVFKSSEDNLKVASCWLIKDDLFFEKPTRKARRAIAISYQKNGGGWRL